jgi:C-terminal processing protease CtpA/Prc
VKEGDAIVAVNGTAVSQQTQDEVTAMFRAAGSKLTLTLATQQPESDTIAEAVATATAAGGLSSSGGGGAGAGRIGPGGGGSIGTVLIDKAVGAKLGIAFSSGTGLLSDPTPETHTIVAVAAGAAGALAGVKEGDTIVAINGTLVSGRSHENVNALFKGAGDTFTLTLQSNST